MRPFKLRHLPVVLTLALLLAACGGDDGGGGEAAGGGTDTPAASGAVTIDNFMFMPDAIEVAAGTTVTWTNQDDNAHTVEDEGDLFPESEELAKGQSFSFTYDTPGEYPYICGIHPYMKGTVTVS